MYRYCTVLMLITCRVVNVHTAANPGTAVSSNTTECWQCSTYDSNDKFNDQCPGDGDVDTTRAYSDSCDGQCFTRSDSAHHPGVYRGCTTVVWGLPNPLPKDGCYKWEAKSQVWCFCSTDRCNGVPMGQEGNMTLEEVVAQRNKDNSGHSANGTDSVLPPGLLSRDPGMLQCWQCQSYLNGVYYNQCPLHSQVDVSRAYIGNCSGRCFSHNSRDSSGVEVMFRGCTDSVQGLPTPLPEDGCYPWRGETWCICGKHGCNGRKLGRGGNMTLEEVVAQRNKDNSGHSANGTDSVLPPGLLSRDPGMLQCWQCQSYLNGVYYNQCPLHSQVDVSRAYIGNCSGRCFSHNTRYRSGVEVMFRGCTDTQQRLPNPLPEDGCYPWFGETWCICSNHGCNGVALGKVNKQWGHRTNSSGRLTFDVFMLLVVLLHFTLLF